MLLLAQVYILQYDIYAIIRQMSKLKTPEDLQRSNNIVKINENTVPLRTS